MTEIVIQDTRFGPLRDEAHGSGGIGTFGVNGKFYTVPINIPFDANDDLLVVIINAGLKYVLAEDLICDCDDEESGPQLTFEPTSFSGPAANGTVIGAIGNPFVGATTYAAIGSAGVLNVTGSDVTRGPTASVDGVAYGIKIRATAADGQSEVAKTFSLTSIGSSTIPDPTNAFIWDDDFETDPDAWANLAYIIQMHRTGVIDLKGIIVCSAFNTAPPAVRACLDAYGLNSIPIGWTGRSGLANPDFSSTKMRDKFGKTAETGAASRYFSAAALYRQLLVDNYGIHIATGGFTKPLVELLNSTADGISSLNGADLIAARVPNVYIGLGMRPSGHQGTTSASWTGNIEENNTAFDRADAVTFCANFPGNIVFYAFPHADDFAATHLPVHVKNTNDTEIDPIRYGFVAAGTGVGTGTTGFSVGPLFDSNNERLVGDIVQAQVAIDHLLGTPTAHFTLSAVGAATVNSGNGFMSFALGGHGRHRYATLNDPTGMHTYWQGVLDALSSPSSVNLYKDSTNALNGNLVNGATKTDNAALAPDGTMTADRLSGAGFGGHEVAWLTAASHAYTHTFFIKKTTGRTRFPCYAAQFRQGDSTVISEAGCIINTNTGAVYAATGVAAPAFGSVNCTATVVDGSTANVGPNAGDYWFVKVRFTTPALTVLTSTYYSPSAGSTGTDATRDGSGATVTADLWGHQLEPVADYGGALLVTDGDCTWKIGPPTTT